MNNTIVIKDDPCKEDEEFLKHSTTHPKYLESNSTSHSWVFGAMAELLDNAQDAKATLVSLDVLDDAEHVKMISVQDNGCGMDYKALHRMLSFGHCSKKEGDIGRYGNGFKSGSMRMGSDAMVFTKDGHTKSVGMLSRTFLAKTNATEVLVPMVSWSKTGEMLFTGDTKEAKFMQNSLKVINDHSPFIHMQDIEDQLDLIKETGARIIIWNLRKIENTQEFELDFDHDETDIILRDAMWDKNMNPDSDTNEYNFSLKMYLKILYLVPKMRFMLRGEYIRTVIYPKTLHLAKTTVYKPKDHDEVKITFGFNNNRRICGMMLYNKNRLIESFLALGIQMEHNSRGKGVIGVCDANFLQPTHNKQKFVATSAYHKLKLELAKRLRTYWMSCNILPGKIGEFWDRPKKPDEEWLQCDTCLKWRCLPKTKLSLKESDVFTCSLLDLKSTEVKKEEKIENNEEWPDTCKVPQAPNCLYSKIAFLATEGQRKVLPGHEHWIGARVSIYRSSIDTWLEGLVLDYDNARNKYKVEYNGGEILWEKYNQDGFVIVTLPEKSKDNNNSKKRKQPSDSDNEFTAENEESQSIDERPRKKQKTKRKVNDIEDNNDFDNQNTIRENRMLKKKISFIVNSLAKQGLITTDFIDLVEEDKVLELDEVKLCDSLPSVANSHSNNNDNGDSEIDYTYNGIEPDPYIQFL